MGEHIRLADLIQDGFIGGDCDPNRGSKRNIHAPVTGILCTQRHAGVIHPAGSHLDAFTQPQGFGSVRQQRAQDVGGGYDLRPDLGWQTC